MIFIELTTTNANKFFVQPRHIVSFSQTTGQRISDDDVVVHGDDYYAGSHKMVEYTYTEVRFVSGDPLSVTETPDQIRAMISQEN